MNFNYSITLSSFKDLEPLEETLKKIEYSGLHTIEMYDEIAEMDQKKIYEIINTFNFNISGITGNWTAEEKEKGEDMNKTRNTLKRCFITNDKTIKKHSIDYVKKCIKSCNFFNTNIFNICILADNNLVKYDKNHTSFLLGQKKKILDGIIPDLISLSKYAKDFEVVLVVEPLSRFSTPYMNSSEDAIYLVKKVNHDNFLMMLDTFHMNIEEDKFDISILKSKQFLNHLHFADNNRKFPGIGHIDFKSIIEVLKKIKYNKFITFEPNITNKKYVMDIKNSIFFLESIANKK